MSLESVIDTFVTHPRLQIKRRARGAYVDERYEDGASSYFRIAASIRPDTGSELQNVSEGQSEVETRIIYTRSELWARTRDTPSGIGHDPDIAILGAGVVAAAAASADMSSATVHVTSVIGETIDGVDGNLTTLELSAGVVSAFGVLDENNYPAVKYTFLSGVTTVADMEAAIRAGSKLTINTAGNQGAVLMVGADEVVAAFGGGFGEEWRVTRAKQFRAHWKVWIERLDKP